MAKYRIIQRYEWYSPSGITWSKWYSTNSKVVENKDELKEDLVRCQKRGKDLQKITKLQTEYKIEEIKE